MLAGRSLGGSNVLVQTIVPVQFREQQLSASELGQAD